MFGNLIRELGAVEKLNETAQGDLAGADHPVPGVGDWGYHGGEAFSCARRPSLILGMGLLAFVLDTVGGVMFGKLMYVLSGKKFNPLIGAAGISAFPMSARIVQKFGAEVRLREFPADACDGR